ncbi:MAG: dimethyl sulfoxide reductase anchor subunit [Xanthomonadales bacterium]|nr:dimethyl sulfoxide reductase anchor subunit [Xanthomonadales bacterium]
MANRDWSLMFFTTLAQWSVGIMLWLTWPVIHSQDLSPVFETGLSLKDPVLLALIFISSATLSSFLHLGNPVNAPRALNNLSGSWLSREILAIGVFVTGLLITFILGWRGGNPLLLKLLMVLSSIGGMALLWTMSRIYVMPTIPAWNSWNTPVSFISTALVLGLLTLLFLNNYGSIIIADHIHRIFWIALIAILLIEIVSAVIQQFKLATMDQGMDKLVFHKGTFYRVFLFRMAILIFICQLAVILAFKPELLPGNSESFWISLLFISGIAQELTGRLLFYSSYFRIGV